ncbi:MAG TPA: hypothetical protein VM802_21905 [Chitinophaga sp.]|uniref:hypothetical protein n=1 Tax=Chitinophaga sp. TaxID=1869181 RepID=UPI002C945259|nr:hypothetical protein [Chitinophaga sp.]HVI47540.1 hypothetical protein [Chitinophaga sp.]
MTTSPSIAQEFYKIRNEWAAIDRKRHWQLAIWSVQFADVDIIDKFIEIERTAVGVFEDIFFRFDTPFTEDTEAYEKALWNEYVSWFEPVERSEYDIYGALKKDGFLKEEYTPNLSLRPCIDSIWRELLRFRSCVKVMEKLHFCIYFPPVRPDMPEPGPWFTSILKKGVPEGIRLVTIDIVTNPKVVLPPQLLQSKVAVLQPKLEMVAAINNEMDKGGGSADTINVDARFRKQVRKVMECTLQQDVSVMDTEISTLLSLSKKMGGTSAAIAGLMIASQAYFMIKESDRSLRYAEKAIAKSELAMKANDPAGYPTWKSCMMIKAAILVGKKKRKQAVEIYETLAEEAANRADAFMIMEGYRLSGHLYYEMGQMNTAFESLLLAIEGGSYMELSVRRQSTFLHAACLAMHIGEKIRGGSDDMDILRERIHELLGDDWQDLLQEENMEKAIIRRKPSLFEFN